MKIDLSIKPTKKVSKMNCHVLNETVEKKSIKGIFTNHLIQVKTQN